jgi:hypothetical protein
MSNKLRIYEEGCYTVEELRNVLIKLNDIIENGLDEEINTDSIRDITKEIEIAIEQGILNYEELTESTYYLAKIANLLLKAYLD